MPENLTKILQSVTPPPVGRGGAGDISEREFSRERYNLQTTPPARLQPVNPKKLILSSAPVNKFTTKVVGPSPYLARIRSCLNEYSRTPTRPMKIGAKAVSMEDLTPTKRSKHLSGPQEELVGGTTKNTPAEVEAGERICRFLMLAAWRRRRDEVRCLRKTLEFQLSCSERLRIQVKALKRLLDADNSKVRMAMKELERLKQLLHDKESEKQILEQEKLALQSDVCTAEDRASDMSIGWRNCRNDLEASRSAHATVEHALSLERAATAEARAQRDHAYARLQVLEAELAQHETLLSEAEEHASTLRREADEQQHILKETNERLALEKQARERCLRECTVLSARVTLATQETSALKNVVTELRGELVRLDVELRKTREQLDWWPRPFTKMLGAARSMFRYQVTFSEAVLWSLLPARHGC